MELCPKCNMPPCTGCKNGVVDSADEMWGDDCPNLKLIMRRVEINLRWPIPARFRSAVLGSVLPSMAPKQTEAIRAAHAQLVGVLDGIKADPAGIHPGVVIGGGFGVGKTHLAAALANQARSMGLASILVDATELLITIKRTFGPDAKVDGDLIYDDITGADLLILDDVGKQRHTDFADETLWSMVSRRYNEGRSTVITSNLGESEIAKNHTWGAICDRLIDQGIIIHISGPSLRKVAP